MLYGNNLRAVKESSLTSDPFSPILAQRISFLVSAGNNLSILFFTKFWRNLPLAFLDLLFTMIRPLREEHYNFSEDERDDVFEWFAQAMQKFEKSFNPLLENL